MPGCIYYAYPFICADKDYWESLIGLLIATLSNTSFCFDCFFFSFFCLNIDAYSAEILFSISTPANYFVTISSFVVVNLLRSLFSVDLLFSGSNSVPLIDSNCPKNCEPISVGLRY